LCQGVPAMGSRQRSGYAGEFTASGLAAALGQDDPVAAIRAFTTGWVQILRKTEFAGGCPVVAASLEGERLPGARDAAADAFARWEQMLSAAFAPHVSPARARSLATLAIAAIEGAVVLARAQRSTEPLERVTSELEALRVRRSRSTETNTTGRSPKGGGLSIVPASWR
jgi:TetR/AcrR family transcriptional repressor of lmrAB and yxaGH operons